MKSEVIRHSAMPERLDISVILIARFTRNSHRAGPHRRWAILAMMLVLAWTVVGVQLLPADEPATGIEGVVQLLQQVDDEQFQLDVLQGMLDSLRGRRDVKMPTGWSQLQPKLMASNNSQVRQRAIFLSLLFGDQQAVDSVRHQVTDTTLAAPERHQALQMLLDTAIAELRPLLVTSLDDPTLRGAALRGLAAYPHPENADRIMQLYSRLTEQEKQDALQTLASRVDTAERLLDEVQRGTISPREVPTYTARQIQDLQNDDLTARLHQVWGVVASPSGDGKQRIAQFKEWLTDDFLEQADLSRGRDLYQRNCATCHVLFGQGGKIGPDLSGSNRNDLHYVLENVLEPSAMVARDYQLTRVVTARGRLILGLVQPQPNDTLIVQTPTERLLIPNSEVEELQATRRSMMPDGLFDPLSREEVRDLIAYLRRGP